jgi:hypothetical protein
MENPSSNQKFVHVSLRMSRETKAKLKAEAEQRGISFNNLTNQIIQRHVAFDRIVEKVGGIPLSRALFESMLNQVSIEGMEAIGKELGPKLIRQAFKILGFSYDLESLIKTYFEPLSTYSGWYSFSVSRTGQERRLLFEHNHGQKWSAFLGQYVGGIITAAIGREPQVAIEDGLVTVTC